MRLRLLPLIVLLIALLLVPVGCGMVSVGFVSNPGSSSVTGLVVAVHLQSTSGPDGALNTFTAVAIQSVSTTNSFNFCGDQRSQFPLSQQVRVNFNSGGSCATLIAVVVL
jgi:hypothetical protein